MCLGEGNERVEEVKVEGGGEKFEVLNFFFSPSFFDDDMHSLARSPFLLLYFICMQICKHREGCEQRLFMSCSASLKFIHTWKQKTEGALVRCSVLLYGNIGQVIFLCTQEYCC